MDSHITAKLDRIGLAAALARCAHLWSQTDAGVFRERSAGLCCRPHDVMLYKLYGTPMPAGAVSADLTAAGYSAPSNLEDAKSCKLERLSGLSVASGARRWHGRLARGFV